MTVEIRLASIDTDLDALVDLNLSVQELHVQSEPEVFRVPRPKQVAAWFQDILGRESWQALLAEEAGQPLGYLLYEIRDRPRGHLHQVDAFRPHPPARRSGALSPAWCRSATSAVRRAVQALHFDRRRACAVSANPSAKPLRQSIDLSGGSAGLGEQAVRGQGLARRHDVVTESQNARGRAHASISCWRMGDRLGRFRP
ncbi:MAG: hypothetical protein M3N52_04500 [Actinomycetota bacterium]|nr:hypothetical protein [Actinomycetota bacterium]